MEKPSKAWLVRAGRHGEREALALERNLAVVGWQEVGDLGGITAREELSTEIAATFPDISPGRLSNWTGQLWAFVHRIQPGDLVVLPLKRTAAVAIGRVTGPYGYRDDLPDDARHTRPVTWLRTDIPRTAIGQDLLYSLGAFMTVCELHRHQALQRLLAIAETGRDPGALGLPGEPTAPGEPSDSAPDARPDFERLAQDDITLFIAQHFAGHGLARLVEAIFHARGMVTFLSPAGPDGGIDVMAGSGPLGMDPPRICVQVKSGASPVDVRTVRELQGVLGRTNADQGLLVAWAGVTKSAQTELRGQFFQVRVWTADDVIRELTSLYDRLPDDVQAELPLKRIWTLVLDEDENT